LGPAKIAALEVKQRDRGLNQCLNQHFLVT
jgi:hypothetical protein